MPADKPAYFDILVFYIRNNIFYKFFMVLPGEATWEK